ncbi:nucleotide-binding domain-containing protein [Oceanicaulis sp.]|uniref:nucleotide-binding domain-containing protein n=1 Tax=Oceanicaulis sp. TaxID=1924941 RepID=UPI003BAA234D
MTHSYDPEAFLQALVEQIQVPRSRYEQAEKSYNAVGDHLNRDGGPLAQHDPQMYVQGSFRLGTAVRPANDGDEYDIDLVCELDLTTRDVTQERLKRAVGDDMLAYTLRYGMSPPKESRRCWTLNYADGAQFHLDVLPALPDSFRQRLLLEEHGHDSALADTAIAITDNETPEYKNYTGEWPRSNPKGYAEWFKRQMGTLYEQRRNALALEAVAKGEVEDVPAYRVQTPLQQLVQLLKHHRDRCFADSDGDHKPISIIITTLAAHAYNEEATLVDAIRNVLPRMPDPDLIEDRDGVPWVANPTNPDENFADRWATHPERQQAFYDWHQRAMNDFQAVLNAGSREEALAALQERVSERVRKAVAEERPRASAGLQRLRRLTNRQAKQPPWPVGRSGHVGITHVEVSSNGYRDENIGSDGKPLWKNSKLNFVAEADIPHPFDVYWQVINTGTEAEAANDLRGDFNTGVVTRGALTHRERTLYSGPHSIECFVVKAGYLVARSGQFIVNIR